MATKTVHVDLKDAGEPGEWAELEDPRSYSQRHFEQVVTEMQTARDDAEAAAKVFRDRISAWHLIDADTGAALSDPKTDDLKGISVGITAAIGEKITELYEATVPKASRKG